MNYPVDMPTVEVTVGPVRHLETSKDLQFRVTFEAVHPSGHEFPGLIWVASGERFMAITQKERSSGENMSLVLPATNAEGWKNFEGAPIDTDGGTLHTHAYQVRLAVYRSGVYISSFTIDKVFLPEGVSPVDLDDLISVPQEPGTPIDFPDVWGALVQQAEAAALAAQQAAELVRDNSIVDASLVGQDLVFEKHDLSTINVGRVVGAQGPPNSLTIGTVQDGAVPAASITGTAPNQALNLTLKTGDAGPPNTLTVGTVTHLPPASTPTASITGTAPNQTLDLGLVDGAGGAAGPPNSLTIGTVQSGPTPAASITGTAPNQTLNLTLPPGAAGVGVPTTGNQTGDLLRWNGSVWIQTATKFHEGTGNPNGVVTAPVGSTFVNTEAGGYNGARRWTKATGSGNTGWVVVDGDTGLIDVMSLVGVNWEPHAAAGGAWLQRQATHTTLSWRLKVKAGAAIIGTTFFTAAPVIDLPVGWRPGTYQAGGSGDIAQNPAWVSAQAHSGDIRVRAQINTAYTAGTISTGQWSFDNPANWPSTLP